MVKLKAHNESKIKETIPERIFSVFNYFLLTIIALIMLYPLINIVAISFSSYKEYLKAPWMIWPKGFTTAAYEFVFGNDFFWRSYLNTILVTAGGTLVGLFVTILFAWPISRRELKGKPFLMALMIFTMVFNAGMVPNYLNLRDLKLLDTLWVLILPVSFSAFNCIIMINFFRSLPYELIEAAMIDGASEPYILSRIVLPLSKPILATITLFLAVGFWNGYFDAQLYIQDKNLWPVALTLKEILVSASTQLLEAQADPAALESALTTIQSKNIQYASAVITILPILCLYPFLQKHFAKGVMVGSVKG